MATHLGRAVESCVGVGRLHLRAHGQRVRDLEHGCGAEGLCELGAQAREAQVVQEDVALHLFGNVLDGARVGKSEGLSPLLEGSVDIVEPCKDAVVVRDDVGHGLLLLLLRFELHGAGRRSDGGQTTKIMLRTWTAKMRRVGWRRHGLGRGKLLEDGDAMLVMGSNFFEGEQSAPRP